MTEWNGLVREDGLRVAQELAGWVILAPDRHAVRFCPCCGNALNNARRAQMVADRLFPPEATGG